MYTNRQNRPLPLLPRKEKHSSLQKNTLNSTWPPEQHVPVKNPRNSTYSTKFHFLISLSSPNTLSSPRSTFASASPCNDPFCPLPWSFLCHLCLVLCHSS